MYVSQLVYRNCALICARLGYRMSDRLHLLGECSKVQWNGPRSGRAFRRYRERNPDMLCQSRGYRRDTVRVTRSGRFAYFLCRAMVRYGYTSTILVSRRVVIDATSCQVATLTLNAPKTTMAFVKALTLSTNLHNVQAVCDAISLESCVFCQIVR
jgi:hypothetical protein